MKLSALVQAMEEIAPARLAEPWDNVGLLIGDPAASVRRVLLTIDYSVPVAREVRTVKADCVIAYHPPIFEPLKRLGPGLIFDAISDGVAIYSPHTALDAAEGGTNDVLADALGLTNRSPLRPATAEGGAGGIGGATQYKLVTFVPPADLEAVSRALFDAGAGRIGDYTSCSFRTAGTGTFFGGPDAEPAVGRRGRLEQVQEVRLEMVVPIRQAAAIIRALLQTHPYEEPAFDLIPLATPPSASPLGLGRIGTFAPPATVAAIVKRLKRVLSVDQLLVAGPTNRKVSRAAVCAGACGKMLDDAIAAGAELYLTGEMRHHDAVKAAAAGLTVLCTLHSNSERLVLQSLAARLRPKLAGVDLILSKADRDPFTIC